MQNTSALYKQIIADDNHRFEVKLNIAGVEYGEGEIFQTKIESRVFASAPTIGGTYASTLEFSIIADGESIPRMAEVRPYFRATDGANTSEWLPLGVFFIDTREVTNNGDGLSVFSAYCYDSMLKANAPYSSSINWPAADTAVVAEICTALGVSQAPTNAALLNGGFSLEYLPTEYTYRDVLSFIGAMYGANWIMDDAGALKLIPLSPNFGSLDIQKGTANLSVSKKRGGYTRVILNVSEDEAYESGSTDERVFEATCPYATQAACDYAYSKASLFEYQPFTASGVWSDPAVELGDELSAVTSSGLVIFSRSIALGAGMVMTLSAPNDNYIDHEYAYESLEERNYKRTLGNLVSQISIIPGEIQLLTQQLATKVGEDEIISKINLSPEQIVISASKVALQGYVTFTNLSTQGETMINGANITTGLIQDSQGKNSWNLNTGALTITDGSINITTDSQSSSRISLSYGASKTMFSASGMHIENTQFSKDVLWTREVFGGTEGGPVQGWYVCASLSTPSGTEEKIGEYGPESWSISDNVNNRKIEASPLRLQLSLNNVVRLSVENYGILVKDTSGNNRVRLQQSGLTFTDGNGTVTAEYNSNRAVKYQDAVPAQVSVPNGTDTKIGELTLGPGLWLITATCDWGNNSSGRRVFRGQDAGGSSGYIERVASAPTPGDNTSQGFVLAKNYSVQTTYELYGNQNSGTSLNAIARIQAVQIA